MKQSKRYNVIISAAGTGGHLFPAQCVAKELLGEMEPLFVGKGLKNNPYFDKNCFAFKEISAATLSFCLSCQSLRALFSIIAGGWQSFRLLRKNRPKVIIAFGSFYTLPLLLAAVVTRTPFVLHEQNILPGKVNRLFAPFAALTALTFEESQRFLKKKTRTEVVAYPKKRSEKCEATCPYHYFNLSPACFTLLVFGGSQGARVINELIKSVMALLKKEEFFFQLLHFIGQDEPQEEWKRLYSAHSIAHCVKAFENQMHYAWNIADLAICRAGAGTLCELLEWETPAILIPFARASENHQYENGRFFEKKVGGGFCLTEKELSAAKVKELILNARENKYVEKKHAIQQYKKRSGIGKEQVLLSSRIKEMLQ